MSGHLLRHQLVKKDVCTKVSPAAYLGAEFPEVKDGTQVLRQLRLLLKVDEGDVVEGA